MIAALVLAHLLVAEPAPLSTDDATKAYETRCKGAAAQTTECKQLQWQLEFALYGALRDAVSAGQDVDTDTWHIAATADCPQLKMFVFRHWQYSSMPVYEKPAVIAALNDPYPGVRDAAFGLVGKLDDPRFEQMFRRRRERGTALQVPLPDEAPAESSLPGPLYPGAQFQFFASDPMHATYVASDSAAKVVDWFKKKGHRSMTGAELRKLDDDAQRAIQEAAQKDPMAYAQRMQDAMRKAMAEGKDPAAAMAAMQTQMMNVAVGAEAEKEFDGKESEGISSPRYVVLAEDTSAAGMKQPSRLAVVYDDAALGGAAIVYLLTPTADDLATANASAIRHANDPNGMKHAESEMKARQMLGDPLAAPNGGD